MKKKSLILALVLALVISGGIYAYTHTTATATIGFTVAGLEIATVEPAEDQPDWDLVLPSGGGTSTEILRPNAAGDKTQIKGQYPDEEEHWDKVDDDTPDDWSTYVYTEVGTYKTDLYNIDNHSQGSGSINGITVCFCFCSDGSTTAYARALIKTANKVYYGSEETQTGDTFVTKSYQWTTNPNTGQAWTWDEIDALQAGVDLRRAQQGGTAYCTQVYVEVDYEAPPVTEGEVPEGDLFIVTPHPEYTGDLVVKVYLTNTSTLAKAYQYLNMKLTLQGSAEAGYQLLTLDNGVVTFTLPGGAGEGHTLEVIGGSYSLNPGDWAVEDVTPELYCEATQR